MCAESLSRLNLLKLLQNILTSVFIAKFQLSEYEALSPQDRILGALLSFQEHDVLSSSELSVYTAIEHINISNTINSAVRSPSEVLNFSLIGNFLGASFMLVL